MLQPGEAVGPYIIRSYLTAGASSEVYEASCEGRPTALKILREDRLGEPLLPWRMANEALALEQFCHPGVVRLLSYGYHKGRIYLALEFLPRSLAHSLPVSPRRAVALAASLANTLAALHAANIVHRDLKPQNVMLTGDAQPKLIDFGLAKLPVAAATAKAPLLPLSTEPETFFGTYEYSAPEQLTDAKDVDGRADVYALGVVLFEMIAGRRPFVAKERGRLLSMHLNNTPPALSMLIGGLPPALVALVARMLAKRPDERPNASEVAAELATISFAAESSYRAWLKMTPLLLVAFYPPPEPPRLPISSILESIFRPFERVLYTGTVAAANAQLDLARSAMNRNDLVTPEQWGTLRYKEAALAKERGFIREALQLYEGARAQWLPLVATQPGRAYKALSICADGIGEMYYHLGNDERTLSLYQNAAHTLPRTLAAAQSNLQVPSFIDYQRALALWDKGNAVAALTALDDAEGHERVLLAQAGAVAADSWQLARVLTLRAEILLAQDKPEEAAVVAKEAEARAHRALNEVPADKRYRLGYLLATERLNEVDAARGQKLAPRNIEPLAGIRELVQGDPENGQWVHSLVETLIRRAQRSQGEKQRELSQEALDVMNQIASRGQWLEDEHIRRWRRLATSLAELR